MECCGFSGPQEFAYSTLPIDDSCYEPHSDNSTDDDGSPIARSDWDETTFTTPHMRLKQVNLDFHLAWPSFWPRKTSIIFFLAVLICKPEMNKDIREGHLLLVFKSREILPSSGRDTVPFCLW